MSEYNVKNARQVHLDTIAGILIVYMIFGHSVQIAEARDALPYRELQRVFYFFMAWFFFKSGMFHNVQRDLSHTFKNSCRRLLIPWGVFILVSHLVGCIFMAIDGDWIWIHWIISPFKGMLLEGSYHWDAPLWFLFSLFLVKMVFHIIQTYLSNYVKFLIPIMGGVISWILSSLDGSIPNYCENIFSGLFFYGLGYCLRNVQYKFPFIGIGVAIYALSQFYPSMVDMQVNVVLFGSYPFWLLWSIGACVTINGIIKCFSITFYPFNRIGEDSMFYYVTHWIVIQIIIHIIRLFNVEVSALVLTFSLFVLSFAVMIILRKTIITKQVTNKIGI